MACMVNEIYLLFKRTRLEPAVHPASYSMGTAVSFLQVSRSNVNVSSTAQSGEVKNKWIYTTMAWKRGFTFTRSQTIHWLTSIQKVPGSNLCNRSVKYNSDHRRDSELPHEMLEQNRFLPHPYQFITLQTDATNKATRNKTETNQMT